MQQVQTVLLTLEMYTYVAINKIYVHAYTTNEVGYLLCFLL